MLSCCRGLCCCGASSVQRKFVSNASSLQHCNVHTLPVHGVCVWGGGRDRSQGDSILARNVRLQNWLMCQPVKHAAHATGEFKCAGDSHAGRKHTPRHFPGYAAAAAAPMTVSAAGSCDQWPQQQWDRQESVTEATVGGGASAGRAARRCHTHRRRGLSLNEDSQNVASAAGMVWYSCNLHT